MKRERERERSFEVFAKLVGGEVFQPTHGQRRGSTTCYSAGELLGPTARSGVELGWRDLRWR